MNYFEHHIGDYAEATAHLTFVEDAAYSRMIRKYYATEKPLPTDVKAVQRLVGARAKEEREAVATVLEEFFVLAEDGWHNARCDAEIARFREGEPEREAKKANEDNRLKRHREERARLFKVLTDNGLHAPWNIGMAELRAMVKALPDTGLDTPAPPLPATAPATPATATQSPVTTTHIKTSNPSSSSQASSEVGVGKQPDDDDQPGGQKREAQIVDLLAQHGMQAYPTDSFVRMTWAPNPLVTDDVLLAAITKAKKFKPNEEIGLSYLDKAVQSVLQRQTAQAAPYSPAVQAAPPAPTRKPQGNEPKGTDESYDEWQARVDAFERAQRGRAA
jgi:uncharacterized protein YdaU (DUF1376 family)